MVALIGRAPEYSPNGNVPRDAAILEAVGHQLQASGQQVQFCPETELQSLPTGVTAVVSMARRNRTLLLLQKAEKAGVWVCNRPSAVQVTVQSRSTTLEVLQSVGLPVVPFWSYEPSEDQMFQCEPELQTLLPGWVKAMHPRGVTTGDVMRVEGPLEADARVMELASMGYTDIIVTRHLDGPLLKAYVVGSHVWRYPQASVPVQWQLSDSCILDVARTLGLDICGIDFILTPDGPFVIDVNDFPSFSPCRDEAARAIAELLIFNC